MSRTTASPVFQRSISETPRLSDELLARCALRAPGYDHEHRFFTEDLAELREAGYLRIAVPKELGGHGLSLAQVVHEQRRLADQAVEARLDMGARATEPVVDVHVAEGRVHIVAVEQVDHPLTKPEAFGLGRRRVTPSPCGRRALP